ncbi:class I SAM-dependent methyltransferase [Hahella aquimaris]|uniref:methyltransferase domain-containing protein n=1 Tax=Hahella sp. HNIBRBA332 TaxID=3015983 RepID=UPI00273B4CEA|nr:class I SAM-dependent methyltransferase [Hahella sp. HNIBRBA332]WLQ13936.1 class I SAM-dependent methyltransferase [Hahella sp. HNIBRBA332]
MMTDAGANDPISAEAIIDATQKLLGATFAGDAKPHLDALVSALATVTGIDLYPSCYKEDLSTQTGFGKAISPLEAGRCAWDIERTRIFMAGVYQAIQDVLQRQDRVELLYAGAGPFGLLLVPLAPLFPADRLRVTLLDIHEASLEALQKVISLLKVSDRVAHIVCADATVWTPPEGESYDILLSETMKHMLQQEPQVKIFSHLQQFLKPNGMLIPSSVQLDAWLHSPESGGNIHLGELFTLDRSMAAALNAGDDSCLMGSLLVPDCGEDMTDLKVTTFIRIYGDHCLQENQSQLTLPRYKRNIRPVPGCTLDFRYLLNDFPDFEFSYRSRPATEELPLPDSTEVGELGVYHLKRIWSKAAHAKVGKLDETVRSREWLLDQLVFELLGAPMEKALATIYQSRRFQDVERWFRETSEEEISAHRVSAINARVMDALAALRG